MAGLDEIHSDFVEKASLGRGSIFQIANECDKLFDRFSQKSTETGQEPAPDLPKASSIAEVPLNYLVGEFHSRFISWASYLGVFAGEHMNLDTKLGERPELADIVLLTLDKLRGNLHHLLAIEPPPAASEIDVEDVDSSSSSSWGIVDDSDDNHQNNLRDFIIGCIRESVGKLNRLAIVIHSSASTSTPADLFARVRRYAARHLAEDMTRLETSFNHTLQFLYPNADDSFKRQILKSALFRFAKLRYWQSHQEKLESNTRQDEELTLGSSLDKGTADVGDVSQKGAEDRKETMPVTVAASSINLSVAKSHAKMEEPEVPIFHSGTRSPRRGGTSAWMATAQYPEAPPVHLITSDEQTVCPYCYTRQEDEIFTDKDLWQYHIDEDLEPFVCIFEICGETASFSNFQDWCRHLRQVHTDDWLWQILPKPAYRCKHPSHDENDPDPHPRDHFETNIVFPSLADILDHFEKSHGQIILIPKAKDAYLDQYFPFIEFLVCPLCQASVQSSIFLASDATIEANEMAKHISNHVHDIAFRLLDITLTSRGEGGTLDAYTSHPPKTLGCPSESSARSTDSKGLSLAIPSFCTHTGPRKSTSGDLYARARTVVGGTKESDTKIVQQENVPVSFAGPSYTSVEERGRIYRKPPGEESPRADEIPQQQDTGTSKMLFPSGIMLLHSGKDSIVDIVFVHGLTGNREKTWWGKTVDMPWPKTLLPSEIPNARILTFGYNAHMTDWRCLLSGDKILTHSMNLLRDVAAYRNLDATENRPIIFVCHSLGGLVCEVALSMAQTQPEEHLQQVLQCTRGIVFLGTPHSGPGLELWALALGKRFGVLKEINPPILAALRSDLEVLERVQSDFHKMIQSRAQDRLLPINITFFFEQLPLPGVGTVVLSRSAILPGYIPIGIRGDHINMAMFDDKFDPDFIAISEVIHQWVRSDIVNMSDEETGILGELKFSDLEHGWALDIGAQLPRFELLSGTLTDESVPGISSARREVVDDVNRILERQGLKCPLPAMMPGQNQIQEITRQILDEMAFRLTPSHVACFLIGSANYYLGIARSVRPDPTAVLRGLARNRVELLDVECGVLGIKPLPLLNQMMRTENDGLSIRQLLNRLSWNAF